VTSPSAPVVVFDLDDTLYLERDYVRGGFRAVADEVAKALPGRRDEIFDILWRDFERGIRGNSFDRLVSALPEITTVASVDRLIAVYRTHAPEITPTAGAERVLQVLRSTGIRCGLVTDGRARQQHAKLDALRLTMYFDRVIVNEARDRFKPDERSFRQIEDDLRTEGRRCWYVADNPAKDFIGPRQRGWRTIRVRMPGQLWESIESSDPKPDFTVSELNAVLNLLPIAADKDIACL
jgi:putative hydrolase of the HAD superfamily